MKLFLFKIISIICLWYNGNTNTGDQIIGKWQNPDKDRQVEIFKKGTQYFGKIHWLKDSEEVKVKKGDIVMKNIEFEDGKWLGKIKVPAKENDFDMEITMPNKDQLNIKAKYGIMSRTKIWSRIK